ncbi:MAG: hypothetical protein Q7J35_15795 [Candidatus Methanoperedens sp.]|nr:hypothetical protein [Candidatus Methanoperedens sp.]
MNYDSSDRRKSKRYRFRRSGWERDPSFGFQRKKSIAVFPKELGIKDTKLLSDFWPHGEAAQSYGIFREKEGFSERANIIVDEKGLVSFVKVYPISQLPDIEEIIRALEG